MIMIHVYSKACNMVASKVFQLGIENDRMKKSLVLLQKKLNDTTQDAKVSVFDDDRNLLLESYTDKTKVKWLSSDKLLQNEMNALWVGAI